MLKYGVKRFLFMILTLWVLITITFALMHAIPGDPIAAQSRKLPPQIRQNLYEKYGLNKPKYVQYGLFLKNLVTKFSLGESYTYPGTTVNDIIKEKAPVSGVLGIESLALGLIIGVICGIVAAFHKNSLPDYVVMFLAIVGIAVPSFVLAALLQYFFTVKFMLLPTVGWGSFKYTILPSLAMSFGVIATYARYTRSSCIEVMNQDYILTAEAKGVSKVSLTVNHILRNAMMPIITILGMQLASVLTGTFVIESIFSIPGIGRYFVSCISNMDYPVILGTTIFVGFLFIVSIFVVDMLYAVIDPRIRVSGKK